MEEEETVKVIDVLSIQTTQNMKKNQQFINVFNKLSLSTNFIRY